MRHEPFVIGRAEADAWIRHMTDAVSGMVADGRLSSDDVPTLLDYLELAARSLVNS
jgi:hemoglobin